MDAPDDLLVAEARTGDLDAFAQLVERHQDVVLRVAARIVGREEAEDVAQDSFLRAYHRLDRFRGEAPFRSWLLQIVHNTAVNAAVRRRPEPVGAVVDASDGGSVVVSPRQPAESLELSERLARMDDKLRRLRPEHRAVLVLRDVEGLSYGEVAAVTETPIGSVKGRLHRAREELIHLLRTNAYDWELPDGRSAA